MSSARASTHLPRVLVTRPAHQAAPFCRMLSLAGFEPLPCPTIEIAPVDDEQYAQQQLSLLRTADIVIFTSANAVHCAEQLTPLNQSIPKTTRLLAIGPATATALKEHGLDAKRPYNDFSSFGVLQMPELQHITQLRVLLVRGERGLKDLPKALSAAGATLYTAEVYRRRLPSNTALLQNLLQTTPPQFISTTSNEALSNLLKLLPEKEHLHLWHIPLIVNSERGEHLAQSLGFCAGILRASPAGDKGQINTLKTWITQRLS